MTCTTQIKILKFSIAISLYLWRGYVFADNSLGHRDNLSTGINDRQKAEMMVPAGFVSGSSLNALLRNYYFGRNNYDTSTGFDQREWVQGAYLSFRSGYTDTPIGVGIDVHGFYAIKLDGGDGSGGAGLVPLNSKNEPESDFSTAGAALKFRASDNLVQAGDQFIENPVIAGGVSRVFPQTFRGITIKNYSVPGLMIDTGMADSTRLRNQSGQSHLVTNYGFGNKGGVAADIGNPHLEWLGGVYTAPGIITLTLYGGQLSDVWNQYYVAASHSIKVSSRLTLTSYLHYFKTCDEGQEHLGRIHNDTYSGGLTLSSVSQSLTLGLQKVSGATPFDYVIQDDRSFLYLSNAQQYADFNGPGESSWKLQYQTNLKFIELSNVDLSIAYTRGEANLTKVDPQSEGYGYIYNAQGQNAHHWERDVALRYAVSSGAVKGLNMTLRWAAHRRGDGYTALSATRGNSNADEYRVILDYPFSIF